MARSTRQGTYASPVRANSAPEPAGAEAAQPQAAAAQSQAAAAATATEASIQAEAFKLLLTKLDGLSEKVDRQSQTSQGSLHVADKTDVESIQKVINRASASTDNWALHTKNASGVLHEAMETAQFARKFCDISTLSSARLSDLPECIRKGEIDLDKLIPGEGQHLKMMLVEYIGMSGKLLEESTLLAAQHSVAGDKGSYKFMGTQSQTDSNMKSLVKKRLGVDVDKRETMTESQSDKSARDMNKRWKPWNKSAFAGFQPQGQMQSFQPFGPPMMGPLQGMSQGMHVGAWPLGGSFGGRPPLTQGTGMSSYNPAKMSPRACFNCGAYGHMARDCPAPTRPRQ